MPPPTEPPEASARSSAARRVAVAGFALLALALPWSIAAQSLAVGVCVAATLPLLIVTRGAVWPRTPVNLPALGWIAAMVLSTLFAEDRWGSLLRLKKALFPALVPLVALHAAEPRAGRRGLALLLLSAALAAAVGVGAWLPHAAGRARGPAGHYMTFAGQWLLLASAAAGVALATRERRWRWPALLVALLGGAALVASFTRSSWIGAALSGAVMLAVARPRWLPVFVVAIAAALALAPPHYRERALSALDPAHPSNVERTVMWRAGARIFAEHPWTGVGIADLGPVYERYRPPAARERPSHLHSVPFQVAATMGLAGLAAFAWLWAALLRSAALGLRAEVARGTLAAGLRLGVTGALAGFLAAGLFEWNFGDEELLYLLYALVGLAWAARGWDAKWQERA